MNPQKQLSTSNYLLNALSTESLDILAPHLEPIDAPLGHNIYRPHEPITHVYFPDGSMASIVAHTSAGHATEIGVVGCEGAVGLEVVLGSSLSPNESMFQIAGGTHRIAAAVLVAEFRRSETTRDLLLAFLNKMMVQVSQTTLCNRLHSVDERLARWLLMSDDRIENNQLRLTQEFLAMMLGVSRISVTHAAQDLQTKGHIDYGRGNIKVLDRKGLEDSACECYQIVKTEYDRTECDD